MKLFYLISAVVISVIILIISFAQFGATCSWYMLSPSSPPFIVLMQMSILGGIVGGLLVIWWKTPGSDEDNLDEEDDISMN